MHDVFGAFMNAMSFERREVLGSTHYHVFVSTMLTHNWNNVIGGQQIGVDHETRILVSSTSCTEGGSRAGGTVQMGSLAFEHNPHP